MLVSKVAILKPKVKSLSHRIEHAQTSEAWMVLMLVLWMAEMSTGWMVGCADGVSDGRSENTRRLI